MDAEALLTIPEIIDLYFNQRKSSALRMLLIKVVNICAIVRCGTHDYIAGTRKSKMSTSVVTLCLYFLTGKKIIISFEHCLFL